MKKSCKTDISSKLAAYFFDITVNALRHREKEGKFTDQNGNSIIPARLGTHRRYSLEMLRAMAHSMRRDEYINNIQLRRILERIDAFSVPIYDKKNK